MSEAIVLMHTAADSAEIRDRLGEAMLRYQYGMMRPLWHEMTDAQKKPWRERADDLIAFTPRCGLYFQLGPRKPHD